MRRVRPPRIGDHLMVDDESGFAHPRSQMIKRWDGVFVRKDQNEFRNPQEFVRARNDPRSLNDIRPDSPQSDYCPIPFRILSNGKIQRLYTGILAGQEPGIGEMEIECTFYVWPDP